MQQQATKFATVQTILTFPKRVFFFQIFFKFFFTPHFFLIYKFPRILPSRKLSLTLKEGL